MSLYAFENSGAYHAVFAIFFIIMTAMVVIVGIEVYRALRWNLRKQIRRLNRVRYLTCFCIVLQYITFIGYYVHDPWVHESVWNVWIPAMTISLALLSYNISNIYLETIHIGQNIAKRRKKKKKKKGSKQKAMVVWSKDDEENQKIQARLELKKNKSASELDIDSTTFNDSDYEYYEDEDDAVSNMSTSSLQTNDTQNNTPNTPSNGDKAKTSMTGSFARSTRLLFNEKIKPIFWKCIWVLWISCAVSNWLGSLLGWGFHLLLAQAFFYMLWKLIAFLMLLLCVYILYIVKQRLDVVLEESDVNANRKMNESLLEGRKRVKNLIICESVLIVVFVWSVAYEVYVMIAVAAGKQVENVYAQSTLMSMACYFPIWSMIHIILLTYCWISGASQQTDGKRNDNRKVQVKVETKQQAQNAVELGEVR